MSPYGWYVVGLLSVVNICSYMDRMALSVLAPSIKVELQLSDAQLGLLTGLAFSLFYAICGIPIARWADRGVRKNIIALALVVWSAMTALSGTARNFWHLLAARVGIGAGEAGCLPPGQSIICDYVPLERRASVFAIFHFGNNLGIMLGMVLAGWLGETIGWRWTFVALGLPGIALALIVKLTLREPQRGCLDAAKDEQNIPRLGETIFYLWHCKTFRLLALMLILNGFMQTGLNQWWPSFYTRVHGLNISSVGLYLGPALGIGAGIGLLISGLMAHAAGKRSVQLPLRIGGVVLLLAFPTALASLFAPSARSSMLLVSLTTILWSVSSGPIIATVSSVVTSRMRATAWSISIFLTSAIGISLGPFSVGLLSDLLAPSLGSVTLRYALVIPACLIPVMAILICAAAQTLPADLRALGVEVDEARNHGRARDRTGKALSSSVRG